MVGDALTSSRKRAVRNRIRAGAGRLADRRGGEGGAAAGYPQRRPAACDALAAPSVAYSDSASGRYVSSTLFHTGIDDAMQSKAQMVERIPVASEVAKGRYAIGFQQVSELLPVPGVTFVGELPDNLQYITRFAGR